MCFLDKAMNCLRWMTDRPNNYALPHGRATAPYVAADRGFIDEVIEPAQTRPKLIRALSLLENKRDQNPPKKHGNIPL